MIDDENQHFPRQKLELLEFRTDANVKRATFGDLHGKLYAGVRQLRTVIVTTNSVIDFIEVQTDKRRQIDWLTHVDGESTDSSVQHKVKTNLPTNAPWSYLLNARAGDAGTHYAEKFKTKTNTFQIDLSCNSPMQIIDCQFPLVETANPPTIPMRIARVYTDHACFLAVYGLNLSTQAVIHIDERSGEGWRIANGKETYLITPLSRLLKESTR